MAFFPADNFHVTNATMLHLYLYLSKNIPNMKRTSLFLIFSLAFLSFTSCSEDEPETPVIPNEEELITTLKWQLVSADLQDTLNFLFRDTDGDGGNIPVIETEDLKANTTYSGKITLLNELENPVEDITLEVADEAEDHQFFYETAVAGISIAYADSDQNGNPIGILTSLSTADTASGFVTVTLLHMPDKFANGVNMGDRSAAGGESDISLSFNINVKP